MTMNPEHIYLPTIGRDRVEIIMNWKSGVDNLDYVKMRINKKDVILIPKGALMKLALMLVREEEMDSLVPTKSIKVRQFRKQFTIKVQEDVKAGQEIRFTGAFDVPITADTLPMINDLNSMG